MPIVQHAVLNDLIFRVFHATGIPESDAYVVASHLVNSQLYGHDSHGTCFTPAYARGMLSGYQRWEDHEVLRDSAALRIIDAKGANGIVSVTRALDIAVEKAKKSTFGFVGLNHTTHSRRRYDRHGMAERWRRLSCSLWFGGSLSTSRAHCLFSSSQEWPSICVGYDDDCSSRWEDRIEAYQR